VATGWTSRSLNAARHSGSRKSYAGPTGLSRLGRCGGDGTRTGHYGGLRGRQLTAKEAPRFLEKPTTGHLSPHTSHAAAHRAACQRHVQREGSGSDHPPGSAASDRGPQSTTSARIDIPRRRAATAQLRSLTTRRMVTLCHRAGKRGKRLQKGICQAQESCSSPLPLPPSKIHAH